VKNIAVYSLSRRKPRPFTIPGLGDRLHTAMIAYRYSMTHDVPVRLHVTQKQFYNRPDKEKSWKEILSILPKGTVEIMPHPTGGTVFTDEEWLTYLRDKGFEDVELYWYKGPGTKPPHATLLADDYLSKFIPVPAIDCSENISLPKKYMVEQWDSSDYNRCLNVLEVERVRAYYRSNGYEIITVGGEGKNFYTKTSLKHIGYYLANCDVYCGVNSGFFHFAQWYLPMNKIKIYGRLPDPHFDRAQEYGAKLNELL